MLGDINNFYVCLYEALGKKYPEARSHFSPQSLRNILSPAQVSIPQSLHQKILQGIRNIYEISRTQTYQASITPEDPNILSHKAPNESVLMAYDFHVNLSTNEAKLIEINTNASGFLLCEQLAGLNDYPMQDSESALEKLLSSFQEERSQRDIWSSGDLVIIDEDPPSQKMYLEFLMFKSLFNQQGITTSIHDYRDLKWDSQSQSLTTPDLKSASFVYNRFNDFLLTQPDSVELRRAYLAGSVGFSPNPKEYLLLADKQRLVELSNPEFLNSLGIDAKSLESTKGVLLTSRDSSSWEDKGELWNDRKKWFFKPKRAFGGKSSYRGKSITQKTFERILPEDPLIQEYFPAPEIDLDLGGTKSKWKFDLRYFAYQGQVQQVAARIYKGQITNFRQEFGGYATLVLD